MKNKQVSIAVTEEEETTHRLTRDLVYIEKRIIQSNCRSLLILYWIFVRINKE